MKIGDYAFLKLDVAEKHSGPHEGFITSISEDGIFFRLAGEEFGWPDFDLEVALDPQEVLGEGYFA